MLWLAAWVVSFVQKSLNGAVWNSTLMFGYLAVTMSAMCSQASFSTSEPDHMNQEIVTGPPEESPPPEPLLAAATAVAGGQQDDGRGRGQQFGDPGDSHGTPRT